MLWVRVSPGVRLSLRCYGDVVAERPVTSSEVWKVLRPSLKAWARDAGFSRVQSSPPAYAKPIGTHHVTLFAQGSSGGIDRDLGGTFTLNLQKAVEPSLQVHVSDDIVHTTRLPEYFSEQQQAEALAIHNVVVDKRAKPRPGSFLYDIYAEDVLEQRFLVPLGVLPSLDYWMAFVDTDDIAAWGEFVRRHLDAWVVRASA